MQSNIFAIARICLAIGTLSTLLFNNSEFLFYPHKVQTPLIVDILTKHISIFDMFPPEYILIPTILSVIILLLVIIGIYPRYTSILHWWVSYSLFHSATIMDGGDQITAILTILIIPIYLFDNRKWHWHPPENLEKNTLANNFSRFAFLAIRLQMCLLYLQASIAKLSIEEWRNGTVLYYWMTRHDFGRPEYLSYIIDPLLKNSLILPLLTWSVLILEFLLFMSIRFKQSTRNKLLILGILFHFMIFLIHGLFSFFMAMTAGLLLYLMPLVKTNYKLKTKLKWIYS